MNPDSRDSTNLEILNKLVLVESKIVTLANSYNEMTKLSSGEKISLENKKFSCTIYKNIYEQFR